MTVHVRGYRAYQGGFERPRAALAIASEGLRKAFRRKTFRWIGILYLVWFAMCTFWLYVAVGTDIGMALRMAGRRAAIPITPDQFSIMTLDVTLLVFASGASFLTALLAVFIGSGLISDDLAAGALPLYRVRPITAGDYVTGKALVLPWILFLAVAVPGILMYLAVGLWQPPGQSWSFLGSHLEVIGRILQSYLIAAAIYTGLSLFLSSRSSRHAAVAVATAIVLFLGFLLGGFARHGPVSGGLRDIFLLTDVMADVRVPLEHAAREHGRRALRTPLPAQTTVIVVALLVLVLGWIAAWRRTRSVEVAS